MESLKELANALSNGTIPDPLYGLPFPKIGGSQPHLQPKLQSLLSQERPKLRTAINLADKSKGCRFVQRIVVNAVGQAVKPAVRRCHL